MRRRRSSLAAGVALGAALATLAAPPRAGAQGGLAEDGALFLLLPVGARAVGMGQAVVADQPGSEAVWWNPAALAHADKREIAIHHSQSLAGTGDALTLVVPSSVLGVIALSANIFNFGEIPLTGDQPDVELGSILTRSFVYAATYATSIGNHLGAGLSYKLLQFRVDCSGACPANFSFSGTSSALDVGAQYDLAPQLPVVVAISARNLGPRLQVNDTEQSDPLPSRLQLGLLYRVPGIERYSKQAELRLTGDLLDELQVDRPSARVGADMVWNRRVHLRGGYVFDGGEAGGPALGFGLSAGSLVLDIARLFQGLSADAGQAPTYLSLRYLF
jgi:hypothetical protein